jgi:hypothetical protein
VAGGEVVDLGEGGNRHLVSGTCQEIISSGGSDSLVRSTTPPGFCKPGVPHPRHVGPPGTQDWQVHVTARYT